MRVGVVCFFNQIKMQKLPLSDLKNTHCKISFCQKSNYKIILADNTKSQKLGKTYFFPD